MSYAEVTLDGVPIKAVSGVPAQSYSKDRGRTLVRLSLGALYGMNHWSKEVITISGSGLLPHGLDGIDVGEVIELRCTHPKSICGKSAADRVFTLTSTPRPDVAPWGWALKNGFWLKVPATVAGNQVTVAEIAGGELYRAAWMPVFQVICDDPEESMDTAYGWQFTAREV